MRCRLLHGLNRAWPLVVACGLLACAAPGGRQGDDSPGRKAAEVNTQLGQAYMERGQYEVALDKLKKAIRADRSYAPAHTVVAVLYERIGETGQAARHYRDAVEAAPANGDVNNNFGAFLCRSGQPAEADRYFDQALEDPFYGTPEVALSNAGACALRRGNVSDAEARYRSALTHDAAFPDALLGMAKLKLQAQDFFSARGFLQRYEGAAPMSAASLMAGYRIETGLNSPADARDYADRLLERFPKSPEATEIREGRRQ